MERNPEQRRDSSAFMCVLVLVIFAAALGVFYPFYLCSEK